MNLEIVYGENSAARSHYLYKKAWQRAHEGKKTIILVPEQYTLEAEKELLEAKAGSKGMIKIQVMSIKRLMNWIFSDIKRPAFVLLDNQGKTLLIKSILKKHSDELKLFDRAAAMPGFASSIGDFISDIKKFNVTGEALFEALDEEDQDSAIYKKAHDIKTIINYYEKASLEANVMDEDDNIDFLCDVIDEASAQVKDFFVGTSIYFDSFDYIPAKNVQLIFSLLQHVESVSVSLSLDKDRSDELYTAGNASASAIEDAASSFDTKISYKYIEYDDVKQDEGIKHISKYLYSYPVKEFTKSCGVTLIKALGRNEEVEWAAASIVKLVSEGKYTWRDINVTASSLQKYSSDIVRVFKAYNIPYFLDERRTVTSHPVVVWLLSAMQFCSTNLRENLLDMIKTQYAPLTAAQCEQFEDYCIACSIQGGMFLKDFRRGAKTYDLPELNKMRRLIINQVKGFDTGKKNAAGWAKEIYKLLENAGISKMVSSEKIRLEKQGRLDEAAETVQSWNVAIGILDQLHIISSDDVLTADDAAALLEESFLNVQIGILPTGVNRVNVGDVGRSKTSGIKCGFVLGANEGMLPTPMPEGVIFADRELEVLKQKGIAAGRDGEFRKSESSFNLYRALTSPQKRLYISYDCSEEKQSALVVRKIKSLLPEMLEDVAYIDPMASPASAFSASARALGAIGDMIPYRDRTWKEGMSALMKDEKHAADINKMYNFAVGGKSSHQVMQASDGSLISSVSQLEQYAKCPFAYMITYGLQPEKDPAPEIEYVSSGAYLHKVMEEFGREISDKDIKQLTDEQIQIMVQKKARHIAAVFEDGAFAMDAKREFLAEQLIETAVRSGRVYVKGIKNSSFKPTSHEMEFDVGKDFGPIRIDLPNGKKVLLRGKIDRVDELDLGSEKWIRAIDYKSGKKSVDLSGLMTGEDLQLFIYANALKENTGAKAAGVFYFPLRNDYTDEGKDKSYTEKLSGVFVDKPGVVSALDTSIGAGQKSEILNLAYKNDNAPRSSKAIVSHEYFEAALKASMSTAKSLCGKMDKGEMEVNPIADKNTSACAYCDYKNICRFGAQVYNQNQKPSDERAAEYIKGFMEGKKDEVD